MIEKAKEILNSLSSPEVRAENWKDLILNLSNTEVENLNSIISLDSICNNNEYSKEFKICALNTIKEDILEKTEPYITALNTVIERLLFPVTVIDYLSSKTELGSETEAVFRSWAESEYRKADEKAIKHAKDLATAGYHDFLSKKLTENDINKFKKDKASMITPIFFQPPYLQCDNNEKRKILNQVFEKWNYPKYIKIFCQHQDYLFSQFPKYVY